MGVAGAKAAGPPGAERAAGEAPAGLCEPEASGLAAPEVAAGRGAVPRGQAESVANPYLWNEFGDVLLLLKDENGH